MEQTPDEDQWAYFSSEYADSFGVFSTDADWRWEDPDGVEVVHSGFTPILPYLQVSRYREEPSDLSPFPLPSYLRLDTLYYGEQLQQTVLSGLTIWKLAPFTGGVYVNSEDWMEPRRPRLALDGFVEGLLEVNEGTWPEFIKKDKWMDLLINPLESIQNPEWEWQTTYPNCWSVDNEIVWDCLRVSIECAVRILTTIITEQSEWLDTLLFQPSRRWQDIDPKMVFPEGTEARFIEPRKPEDRAKPAELWQRLEELNENTFFGFHDETMGYKRTGAWGVTLFDTNTPTVVSLNVMHLRALCDTAMPAEAKCLAQMSLTTTIVHEIMHATWQGRHQMENEVPNEPFVSPEWICELGESAEQAVFGGRIMALPSPTKTYLTKQHEPQHVGYWRGRMTHQVRTAWPNPVAAAQHGAAKVENYAKRIFQDSKPSYVFHLPLWWTSAMLSEEFWKSNISRNGSSEFKIGPEIASKIRHIALETEASAPKFAKGAADKFKTIWENVKKREILWHRMRPWHGDEYKKWKQSPWSWIVAREHISNFKDAHAMANWVKCKDISDRLMGFHGLYTNNRERNSEDRNAILWIFVCIGTLMQASIPTIDEDVTVYLDEYNLIRHYARDGSKAKADVVMDNPFTETLSCYKSMYKSSSSLVLIFEDLFMSNRDKWAMPPSWIAACTDAARVIKEEHEANLIEDMAVPFTFQVPRYDPTDWAYDERSSDLLSDQRSALVYPQADSKDPDVTMDNTGQPIPDSPDQEHGGVQIRTQPGSSAQKQGGGPAQSRAGRSRKIPSAGSKSRYASSTKPLLRYLTVGEITDHRTVENAWVVEPDGRYGFDVYNITGAVRQLGLTNEQYRGLLVRTRDMCQMLRRDNALTENIRKQFGQAIKPIGKQMLEMYPEEVAECQGQNGAPLWVTVGSYIYDLTGFPFVDNEERDKLIRISKNHITLFAMPQDNLTDDLVGRLSTRRCGNIKCPKTGSRRGLHPFTPRSLRWHDNPSMGVYVAIENIVYDITGYIEDHPGGREVLQKGGGIDQTAQFLLHHPPGCLDGYEHLKVGRLVPEITLEQVGRDQVVVHDCVFDLAGLEQTRPNVYSRLRRLGGTDATPILLNKDSAALADSLSMLNIGEKKNAPRLGNSLLRLFLDEKEAIVAKIRTKKIPEITVGEFQKHDDRDWKEGIWVSVNQDVYNVTDIIRFPQFYRYQIPTFWTGKELRDAELATWLTTEHAARMVARLVPGPPLPEKEQISVEATLEAWSRDGMRKMAATELGPSCVHRAKRFRPDGTGSFEDRA